MKTYFFLAVLAFTHLSLFAETSQGEVLEQQVWEASKKHDLKDLDQKIAPYFQHATFDKVLNKEQYLIHVKNLNIGEFTLSNFKILEGDGIIVVTYDVSVTETINNNQVTSKATRLTVWQKINDNWQMIAHASLIPVAPTK